MRKSLTTFVATATAAMMVLAGTTAATAKDRPTGEQRLEKMLEGREAGEPVSCIGLYDSHNLRVIDKTALVYKRGGTLYVSRPLNPKSLRANDVLVMKRTSSQLCKMDSVHTADQTTGMYTGSVFLGDFVPYRKVG